MITKKPREMNLTDIIKDVSKNGKRLKELVIECSEVKKEKDVSDELLALEPEEWGVVALTLMHLDVCFNDFKRKTTDEERNEWADEWGSFLALVRDLTSMWCDRLPCKNKA